MIGGGVLRARNVPSPSFHHLNALVGQREKFRGGLELIVDALPKSDDDSMGGYPRDSVADLAEVLNKALQCLPLLLLDGVEVALQTGAHECALKISHKLVPEVIPGANRLWG